jgi:hypothetical protein
MPGYMIPVLLDLLTIIFIAAGLFLLCLNLREWRRKKLNVSRMQWDESQDDFHT